MRTAAAGAAKEGAAARAEADPADGAVAHMAAPTETVAAPTETEAAATAALWATAAAKTAAEETVAAATGAEPTAAEAQAEEATEAEAMVEAVLAAGARAVVVLHDICCVCAADQWRVAERITGTCGSCGKGFV